MEDRKTKKRLRVHAGGVFLLVLAAALLLTWYMERTALEQERDPDEPYRPVRGIGDL